MKYVSLFILSIILIGCDGTKYTDETSHPNQLQYYNLIQKKTQDDNGTIISIYVPENSKIINGWDNTIIQYEWYSNNKRNVISIDKLESSNTILYLNDDLKYNDDLNYVWENDWNKDLDKIKNILPHFYNDVEMISFETGIKIHNKYFFRRSLCCTDSRLKNTQYNNKLVEVQYITLFNKRKYTITYRYYGGDKGIGELISMIYSIGGSIQFE